MPEESRGQSYLPPGRLVKKPRAEPIPGYRLVAPLGKGGFGEVWRCEAPGGIHKAIKFVTSPQSTRQGDHPHADQELKSLQRIKDIRHPFVLSLDRVEFVKDELVIVMELADESLQDLLTECQAAGLPGIPRSELVAYLCEAAEALDLMNVEYGLQHLDVKPRNLFLLSRHVKVADFGLVNTLQAEQSSDGTCLGGITPLYAPPETFTGVVAPTSDQYSLAIVYQELLTGTLPFKGRTARQLALMHAQSEPDLAPLPPEDRPIVAKALSKQPAERFPSCLDFLQALISGQMNAPAENRPTKRFQVGASALIKRLQGMPEMEGSSSLSSFLMPRPLLPGQSPGSNSSIDITDTPQPGGLAADETHYGEDPSQHYRYIRSLHRGPLGELWKVETPEGKPRMLRILHGFNNLDSQYECEAVRRLVKLTHPVLAPVEILHHEPGRIVLSMDLVEENLQGRLQRSQEEGWPGVPREELIGHMQRAAEMLDEQQERYAIQHLALNPRSLLLRNGEIWITDFGLVQMLLYPSGRQLSTLNPRYTAPELAEQRVSRTSDQFSLGVIYAEMLTGLHPYHGRSMRQVDNPGTHAKPDLDGLPPEDREIIAQVLSHEPDQRFKTCTELAQALTAATRNSTSAIRADATPLPTPGESSQAVTELVTQVAGPWQMNQFRYMRYLLHPGEGLVHKCGAHLLSGMLQLKVQGFCEEWHAHILHGDENGYRLLVHLQPNIWQRFLGKQPGLEVGIHLQQPRVPKSTLTEVTIHIRPVGCTREQGERLLKEAGPMLLDSVRASLQANPERRIRQRLRYEKPVRVSPIFVNAQQGQPIEARSKDLSVTGMGLYLPCEPPSADVCLYVSVGTESEVMTVPAKVVRIIPCAQDWFEVGTRFLLDDPFNVREQLEA